ncbi:LysM domain/BON superfamily protein [Lacunisphaera limnophila]|uniref:LysM domain/BON superfamily protein n=1 Tax=Lacunisphaera limnophila TaxID=1838286 RepID=A0A1D8AUR2_9BACT|nr:LysM peptidoglycan-binding domain-containing protein [Lacunisphaera limnophila]AOS44630.1 LysM domain/BON superfamily protein [Lacunisphaera limnophila]
MPRLLKTFRHLWPVLTGLLVLGLAGCGDNDRLTYASELDEPNYREGLSLMKAGRRQEALTAFLKVVDKRRDDAPESHLEVGLLYAQHINDPLSAIYHFRKYLALRPNSPQAPLVRQRIDAAIREFARTIPAQPLDRQVQRVDLIATLDRLKEENDALKLQLAEARAGRGVTLPEGDKVPSPAEPVVAPAEDFTFSVDTLRTVRTRPAPPAPARVTPAPPAATSATPARSVANPPAPAATAARQHVVRPGDTLSKLAQQYYNNRAKWRDIYAANRNVMRNEGDLKVGMQLKIP